LLLILTNYYLSINEIVFTRQEKGKSMYKLNKWIFFIAPCMFFTLAVQALDQFPSQLDDGWQVALPESVGMDPSFVTALKQRSENGIYKELVSVIVVKKGKLIIEEYFNGNNKDTKHDVRSAGKSFTSTLFGLTIDKGLLKSEEQYAFPFIKDYLIAPPSKYIKKLKLKHLLSMSSGFDANVNDLSSPGNEEKMYETADWVEFAVNVPFVNEPGKSWAYASINPTILGFVLETAVKEPLADFADKNLFTPLNITDYIWRKSPKGRIIAAGNLLIKARDMAKLGQLYLDKGKWNGKQVVSEAWINKATSKSFDTGSWMNDYYGYLWWLRNFKVDDKIYPVYYASGNGGQKIYVVPDKALVVAIQTTAYGKGWAHRQSTRILMNAIAAANFDSKI